MSYRNDHDAALYRVDALEVELKRVAAERDRLRAKLDERDHEVRTPYIVKDDERERGTVGKIVVLLLGVLFAVIMAAINPHHHHHHYSSSTSRTSTPVVHMTPKPAPILAPIAAAPTCPLAQP